MERAENCVARALAVETQLYRIVAAEMQATQAQFSFPLPQTTLCS
jgi:hypothetical protein